MTATSTITYATKPSKYNFFIKYDGKSFYGYNFLYRSLVRIPIKTFRAVDLLLKQSPVFPSKRSEMLSESIQALREANFLVPLDMDETALIRFKYFRSLFANDTLSLVVLPTMRCNFSCPYCFEFKRPVTMNSKVERALVYWAGEMLQNKRHLTVGWFGGEPLLAKEAIIRLSEQFQSLCGSFGTSYQSTLTTNGFLLGTQFQKRLASLGIGLVQITLDGDREAHDKTRCLANGQGSFDRIYKNILAFCEDIPDCDLTLRMNCGDDNYAGVEKLIKKFPPAVRAKASIYFRWIWPNEATGYKEFSRSARGKTPYKGLSHLYRAAKDLGWRTENPLFRRSDGYCEADHLDHFEIGPNGNVFICSHTFHASEAIGSVLDRQGWTAPRK